MHKGQTCKEYQEVLRVESQEEPSEKEISQACMKRSTKFCPRCKRRMDKESGCDHMTCEFRHLLLHTGSADWCQVFVVTSSAGSVWLPTTGQAEFTLTGVSLMKRPASITIWTSCRTSSTLIRMVSWWTKSPKTTRMASRGELKEMLGHCESSSQRRGETDTPFESREEELKRAVE